MLEKPHRTHKSSARFVRRDFRKITLLNIAQRQISFWLFEIILQNIVMIGFDFQGEGVFQL